MSSKKRELIYSQQNGDFIAGRAYSNPRFFSTPRSDVSKVLLVGDWPKIRAAYEAMGVPVERIDEEAATSAPLRTATAPAALTSALSPQERAAVSIPDDWADLPWSKPNADGVTLRGLAATFSDTPVLNKAQAAAAIEAEVARRAAAAVTITENADEMGSNGLSRREMHADLEAASVDFDPALPIEELVEKYARATEA